MWEWTQCGYWGLGDPVHLGQWGVWKAGSWKLPYGTQAQTGKSVFTGGSLHNVWKPDYMETCCVKPRHTCNTLRKVLTHL